MTPPTDPADIVFDEVFRHTLAVLWPPRESVPVALELDADIVQWFQQHGRGWKKYINAVLLAYVESEKARHGRGVSQ